MRQNYRKKYTDLLEAFEECSSLLSHSLNSNRLTEKENYYMTEFICFKELEEEYNFFKENAHEAYDPDNPFSPLVL